MVFEIALVVAFLVITEEEIEVGGAKSLFGLLFRPLRIADWSFTPAYRNH